MQALVAAAGRYPPLDARKMIAPILLAVTKIPHDLNGAIEFEIFDSRSGHLPAAALYFSIISDLHNRWYFVRSIAACPE